MITKLTIGMPVYNDLDFIEKSIVSILDQEYQGFKLIISDDSSSDGSEEVCRRFAAKDSRITYIRQPKNLGISKNMEYLLSKADTKYFMWSADDDLWDKLFISKLISALESSEDAISAFCDYFQINEIDQKWGLPLRFDYAERTAFRRLLKFIRDADDGFGYGIFKTEQIRRVRFPIWYWPNKKTAYNNIFPSLCFYLAKGNYIHLNEPLFYKRVKTENHVNHTFSGEGNAIRETLAYILRRCNLVLFSAKMISKGGSFFLSICIFPFLIYHWFLRSALKQIQLASTSFFRNRILRLRKKARGE
jgi:glycosyltransferase involved in cell wall biosynthesis